MPLAVTLVLAFAALGTWQLERRTWKLGLIARVEQRVHAPAAEAPNPEAWPRLAAENAEYRRLRVRGQFLDAGDTLVQAVSDLGAGYWVLTPLRTDDGRLVLVNRGFVPPEARGAVAPVGGPVTVTGLLRLTEPRGGFLRTNDPVAGRWYSRDVAAIAAAHGLRDVAPYFIDAQQIDGAARPGTLPVPGLTVVAFHNNHLVYALTWYTLALMVACASWRLMREEPVGQD
ncbi:MAG: SURF1 family protein [Pseudomonadota bacterium]|nr:SURF1 family protein [Pseudomonadota bacterium]